MLPDAALKPNRVGVLEFVCLAENFSVTRSGEILTLRLCHHGNHGADLLVRERHFSENMR